MNDLGLAAAVMARYRADDDSRYDGWVALSALPAAPVVHERRRRLPTARAAVLRKPAWSSLLVGHHPDPPTGTAVNRGTPVACC